MQGNTILITPQMAEAIMRNNTVNRTMRPGVVEHYAAQMAAGLWRWDICPPVIVGTDGVLIDGQHRLAAIVRSGMAGQIEIRQVEGDSPLGMPIDVGLRRTPRDILGVSRNVSAVIRTIAAWKVVGRTVSTDDLADGLRRFGPVAEDICDVSKKGPPGIATAGTRAALVAWIAVYPDDAGDALSDYDRICSGIVTDLIRPSFALLYPRLIASSKGKGGGGHGAIAMACLTVEALSRPMAALLKDSVATRTRVYDLTKDAYAATEVAR